MVGSFHISVYQEDNMSLINEKSGDDGRLWDRYLWYSTMSSHLKLIDYMRYLLKKLTTCHLRLMSHFMILFLITIFPIYYMQWENIGEMVDEMIVGYFILSLSLTTYHLISPYLILSHHRGQIRLFRFDISEMINSSSSSSDQPTCQMLPSYRGNIHLMKWLKDDHLVVMRSNHISPHNLFTINIRDDK